MALVLVTAWGTRGDVTPYVAIASELQKRGHEVKLISNPVYKSLARDAGLSLVPVGTVALHEALVNDPGVWQRDTYVRNGIRHVLPLIEMFYRSVSRNYRPGETVLIPSREGPWIAKEKLALPAAQILEAGAPGRCGISTGRVHAR